MPTINRTEKAILLMTGHGRDHHLIAKRLKLTPDEVAAGIAAVRRKLRARTDCHAMAKALRRHLVPLRPRAATLRA